jgi:hypothetical protein
MSKFQCNVFVYFIYYAYICSRHEYSYNTAHLTLSNHTIKKCIQHPRPLNEKKTNRDWDQMLRQEYRSYVQLVASTIWDKKSNQEN